MLLVHHRKFVEVNITIGTWNTRTLRAAGKLQELIDEMDGYYTSVVALSAKQFFISTSRPKRCVKLFLEFVEILSRMLVSKL